MGNSKSKPKPQNPQPVGGQNVDLGEAASDGNYNRCVTALKASTDPGKLVNKANPKGNVPLHYAAMRGDTKMCALILGNGALPNKFNSNGWTALHFAAHSGHAQVIDLLLECGADAATTRGAAGPTAVSVARKAGHQRIVEIIDTRLQIASGAGSEDIPLWKAAENGDADLCRELIAKGASPDEANKKGMVPLHFAAIGGHTKACVALLEAKADIQKTNARGWSALHYAANSNVKEACMVLLDHPINPLNPAAKNQDGKTAADLAVNPELKAMLREAAANGKHGKPLWKAAHDADIDLCKRMVTAGADPNEPNGKGNTPLHYAALTGSVDLCMFLIECGASVDTQNGKGDTPRDFAVKSGKQVMIDLFSDFSPAPAPGSEAVEAAVPQPL